MPEFNFKQEIIESFDREFVPRPARAFQAQRLTTESTDYSVSTWKSDLNEAQTKLASYIDQYLPFDSLVNIKVHHPLKKGNIHFDFSKPHKNMLLFAHNRSIEPCGYRMVLSGNRTGDLGIETTRGLEQPTLPNDTDWYVLGHTNVPHSITHSCLDRYVLFCHAWINKEKHRELIARSLEKYKDFAIWN